MADLLMTQEGIETLYRIAGFLGHRRMSRNLKRSFYRAYYGWKETGRFNIEDFLNDLNPETQNELRDINQLMKELGCVSQYWIEKSIYVDGINGNDVTGNGSEEYPYRSFAFLERFPKAVDKRLRIMIVNDMDAAQLSFENVIGEYGCISIMGVGEPNVVTTSAGAGPFTLTGVTAHGTAKQAYDFTVANNFGVDELYGKWIRFETGDCAGEVLPVHQNSVNDLWTRAGWSTTPSIGDTFVIVTPAVTLKTQVLNIGCSGPKNIPDNHGEGARFNLWNLNIDIRGAYSQENQFVLSSEVETQISFCTLITDNTDFDFAKIESNLNWHRSWDLYATPYSNCTIDNLDLGVEGDQTNCGLLFYCTTMPNPSYTEMKIQNRARKVAAVDGRGLCNVSTLMSSLSRCAIGTLIADEGASCEFALNLISGNGAFPSINLKNTGPWTVTACHFFEGSNMFSLRLAKLRVVVGSITKGTLTGYGFLFDKGNAQVVVNDDPAALAGTTGSIWFPGAVGATAFPAADAAATDSLGNIFARIETV